MERMELGKSVYQNIHNHTQFSVNYEAGLNIDRVNECVYFNDLAYPQLELIHIQALEATEQGIISINQ